MSSASRKTQKPGRRKTPAEPTRVPETNGAQPPAPDRVEELTRENRQLSEQVKRLVRLESQLQGAREKMELQCKLYAQLYETGRKLNSTLDFKQIISVVTQFVLYDASFQLCVVLLRRNGGDYAPAGMDGYYEEADLLRLSKLTVATSHPVIRRITSSSSQVLCPQTCTDTELRDFGTLFGMDEYVLFPLCGETGSPNCVLLAGNRAENAEYYSRVQDGSQVLVVLANFVAQASAALRNVRLYTELQHERDGLELRVTERTAELEKTEKLAKENELQLRTILENTVDIIYTTNLEGVMTYVSPTIRLWGYEPGEIIGKNVLELVHPDDAQRLADEFKETITTGRTFPSYFRVFTRDGKEIHVEEYGKPIMSGDQINGLTGVIRDVTRRREMEEALRQSEERFRTLVSNLPVGLYRNTGGPKGRFLQANPEMARMFGYESTEDFMKVSVADLYQDPARRKAFVAEVMKNGAVRDFPLALRKKDGSAFWASCTTTAHYNEKGEIDWMDGIIEDITERKLMEEEIKDSQRRLADILQFLPDATFVVDTEGRVTAWNRAMETLTGISARDMIGKGDYEYAIPFYGKRRPVLIDLVRSHDDAMLKNYANVRREGAVLLAEGYAECLKAGGWFEAAAAPLKDAEGRLVGAIETYRDITVRKQMESELKESQRRLADIIEFLPDATFAINAEGKITAWNRAVEVMTGVKAKDVLGKGNYEHAIPFYGERRPVLIDLVMQPLDEIMQKYAHLQRHGDILTGQGHITNIGGGDLYFVGCAAALRDSSGKIAGAIETVRDVTDRKRFAAMDQSCAYGPAGALFKRGKLLLDPGQQIVMRPGNLHVLIEEQIVTAAPVSALCPDFLQALHGLPEIREKSSGPGLISQMLVFAQHVRQIRLLAPPRLRLPFFLELINDVPFQQHHPVDILFQGKHFLLQRSIESPFRIHFREGPPGQGKEKQADADAEQDDIFKQTRGVILSKCYIGTIHAFNL